jgi:hypothetical protein
MQRNYSTYFLSDQLGLFILAGDSLRDLAKNESPLSYATERAKFGRCEIRVLGEAGEVVGISVSEIVQKPLPA